MLVVEGAVLFNWTIVTEIHILKTCKIKTMYNSWGHCAKGWSAVTK